MFATNEHNIIPPGFKVKAGINCAFELGMYESLGRSSSLGVVFGLKKCKHGQIFQCCTSCSWIWCADVNLRL